MFPPTSANLGHDCSRALILVPKTHGRIFATYVEGLRLNIQDATGLEVWIAYFSPPKIFLPRPRDSFVRLSGKVIKGLRHQVREPEVARTPTYNVETTACEGTKDLTRWSFDVKLAASGRMSLRALLKAIWLVFRALPPLSRARLNSTRHHDVVIGDLALATAFRRHPALAGRIQWSMRIVWLLARAEATVECLENWYSKNQNALSDSLLVSTYCEHTYLDALVARTFAKFGIASIGANRSASISAFCASTSGNHFESPWFRAPWTVMPASSRIGDVPVSDMFEQACDDIRQTTGLASVSETPWRKTDSSAGLTAFLYLHDFGDGQYFHGVNEFSDLMNWVDITLELLLKRGDVRVFLKTHPILKEKTAAHNSAAHKEINRRWGKSVEWWSERLPISEIRRMQPIAVMSHHGTVIEELAREGLTGIASRVGPWGRAYTFGHKFESLDEYEWMVKSLEAHTVDSARPEWTEEVAEYSKNRYGLGNVQPLTRITELVSRDILGIEPSWNEVQKFLADTTDAKRRDLVDEIRSEWRPDSVYNCGCGSPKLLATSLRLGKTQ